MPLLAFWTRKCLECKLEKFEMKFQISAFLLNCLIVDKNRSSFHAYMFIYRNPFILPPKVVSKFASWKSD